MKLFGLSVEKKDMAVNPATFETRSVKPALALSRKPIVVFDMAFKHKGDRRYPMTVPSSAMFLAGALKDAEPRFMRAPFIQGGKIDLPESPSPIFAVSLYDHLFLETQRELRDIKRRYPQAKIILGGPSVNTSRNLRALASFFPEATALVKGDGEKVIGDLVAALSTKAIDREALMGMKGVYIRENGFEHWDEMPNLLSEEELNSQPGIWAYTELVQDIKKKKALSLSSSRSCKYRCVFCSHKYHPQPIYWTAERLVSELRRIRGMIEKGILPAEARRISFQDDDFLQNRERALDFTRQIAGDAALNKYFSFDIQASVGSFFKEGELDREMLGLLTGIKVVEVTLGTDGFHPEALKYLRKGGYSWPMVKALIEALDQSGIRQSHYVILTYPEISRQVLIETLENVLDILGGYDISFEFQLSPSAIESNGLMPLAIEWTRIGFPLKRVESEDGRIKYLPTRIPVRDGKLRRSIYRNVFSPAPKPKDLKEFLVGMFGNDKYWRKFNQARERLLGEEWALAGALYADDYYLQHFALNQLLANLRAEA